MLVEPVLEVPKDEIMLEHLGNDLGPDRMMPVPDEPRITSPVLWELSHPTHRGPPALGDVNKEVGPGEHKRSDQRRSGH